VQHPVRSLALVWLTLPAVSGCDNAPTLAPWTGDAGAEGARRPRGAASGSTSSGEVDAGGVSSGDSDAGSAAPDGAVASFISRGVCWNPVGAGARHPEGLDYAGFADVDIALMAELGVNVVRTYEPLLDRAVLDKLWAADIRVIESIYPWGGDDVSVVTERVRAVKDHPAVLYWALGNEWNYNGLYVGSSQDEALARLNQAALLVRAEDTSHPIATIYGELPSAETIAAMPEIDVWGINAYRGISFGDLFDDWRARTDKPMFIAEYGADAYDANLPGYDPESQALAVAALTREILEQATRTGPLAPVLGGTIFEWADEWWKDEAGSLTEQDVGGIAPGGGPYPDQTFNEEWWGLVDLERAPRPAFESLRAVFLEYRKP
jgi:glycosyl hydrolase family 2